MSKKLSRSKRRELRDRGELEAPRRVPLEAQRAEIRAEEASTAARVAAARDEIAAHEEDAPAAKPAPRRDRTLLVLLALTALAGLIFWLTQRSPSKETKIDVPAPTAPATATAKP